MGPPWGQTKVPQESTTLWYAASIVRTSLKPRRDAVIKACGLRSISDFQLLTLERRKSVIQEVMRSLDVRPRQLSRVTGMNYETIRNIAKKVPWKQAPIPRCLHDYFVEPSDCIASFSLEMPLSMHFVALILQNCFSKSTFFRNFAPEKLRNCSCSAIDACIIALA